MSLEKRLREWLMWKVLLPFGFIAAMWPIGWLWHRNHAYERAFAHGEFFIFAAIVFLEVALELKHSIANGDDDFWVDAARIVAIFIIFFYGFIHLAAARAEEQAAYKGDLVYCASFSCAVALFALSVAFFAYWRAKGGVASRQVPQT